MIHYRLVAIFAVVTLTSRLHGVEQLNLVENSQPQAMVITTAEHRAAAEELIHYIRESSGALLPILVSAPTSVEPASRSGAQGAARILVGFESCPRDVRQVGERLPDGGFLIRSLPGNALALAGNGRDGTAFAVYTFLERFVGVRWLWPGESGEYIPKNTALRVGQISINEQPAYVWRDLGPGGALWGSMDKWTAERKLGVTDAHQRLEKLWERHNRFGGAMIYGGHAMGEILPPAVYGPAHPEYYALVDGERRWRNFDGKHGTQPCTTNPDVIRIFSDYAGHFFDQHPDYDAFAISLNDGGGFCECDRCRRLDTGKIETASDDLEGGKGRRTVITDRIVTFANQVAAEVARTHPQKKLTLFAYGPYRDPPVQVKVASNLIIQFTFHAANNWNPASEAQQFKETGAWSGAARNLGVYEYFIQGNWPDLPRLMLEPIQRSVERLYQQGYRYYQTQSGDGYAINSLNYYILARLLWNPAADVNSLQADFFEKGFGRAAPAVTRYFQRWENAWKARKGKAVAMDTATPAQYHSVAEAFPPELREACQRDLDQAARLAQGPEQPRVEFLRGGLKYVELTISAIERTIPPTL
jgi:hypothetical protein